MDSVLWTTRCRWTIRCRRQVTGRASSHQGRRDIRPRVVHAGTDTTTGPPFSRWARSLSVREGGVEPPRPCGHWNLNPARLPIPPPAHWVCLPVPALSGWPLPTSRTLARRTGWVHIPSRPPARRHRALRHTPGLPQPHLHHPVLRRPGPAIPAPALAPAADAALAPAHVSGRRDSRINLVPVPGISPGGGPGPQPGAGHWSSPASTIHGSRSACREFGGQSLGEPADCRARRYDQ